MNSLTLNIPHAHSWTDDDLFEFCVSNKGIKIERDANGFIVIRPLSGALISHYTSLLITQLGIWNKKQKLGLGFNSSAGFLLSDGSMKSPNVSFLSIEKWKLLSKKEKSQFPPLCPEFVVEVRSMTDRLAILQTKMEAWIENGCQLAWLVDPQEEKVHIYRKNGAVEIIANFQHNLTGEEILPDFSFDLSYLKEE